MCSIGLWTMWLGIYVGVCCDVVSVPCNLVVPAGKGLAAWLSCLLCFVTFPNVSWSILEIKGEVGTVKLV